MITNVAFARAVAIDRSSDCVYFPSKRWRDDVVHERSDKRHYKRCPCSVRVRFSRPKSWQVG